MMFWIIAAVMAALVVIALVWPLLRRRAAAPASAEFYRAVYRDQLTELEQDLARGLIDSTEAEAARREIERRLLQTESAAGGASAGTRPWLSRVALALVVALPPAAGLGLYLQLGTPDLPGLPLAERDPGGPQEIGLMVAQLQARLERNPEDIEAHLILAQIFERAGRFGDAAALYRQAIALVQRLEGAVPSALHAALGETLVAATGGQVGREARLAFAAAIEADPGNSQARYYAGLAMAQDGQFEQAIAVWQSLAEDSPPDAPWLPLLHQQIVRAAQEAGIEPPALAQPAPPGMAAPGPSAEDLEAARSMTEAERTAFVRSMVDRLAARLEEQPEDPDGWLRLARAQTVLREVDEARASLARAEAQIAALPDGAPERAVLTQRLEELKRLLP